MKKLVFFLILMSGSWYFWGWNFEDDDARIQGVKKYQVELDTMVTELQKIDHFFQIPIPPYDQKEKGDFSSYPSKPSEGFFSPLSKEQLRILTELNVRVVSNGSPNAAIFFVQDIIGISISSSETGFMFSPKAPPGEDMVGNLKDAYKSKDWIPPEGQGQQRQLYRRVDGDWYLYFDWDA